MTNSIIPAVVTDGFSLSAELVPGGLSIKLTGTGDTEMVRSLGAFLAKVHDEMVALKLTSVSCDLTELYFMNSSCIKCLLVWLKQIRSAESRRYQVRFLTNAKLAWQRRSLEAVRIFAGAIVAVEVA